VLAMKNLTLLKEKFCMFSLEPEGGFSNGPQPFLSKIEARL
jgi:hypothetical protein